MRVDEQEKYTERPTAALSPRQFQAMERSRGDMPRAAWMRDAVLEKLAREGTEITDEARRPAQRRRNLGERQQREDATR